MSYYRAKMPTLIAILLVVFSSFRATSGEPLIVKAPPGWSIEFDEVPVYKIQKDGSSASMMLLSRTVNQKAQIAVKDPRQFTADSIEMKAKSISERFKNAPSMKGIDHTYTIETVEGDIFKGSMARFNGPMGVQIYFTVTDGKETWEGSFMGPESDWKDVLKILLTLKPHEGLHFPVGPSGISDAPRARAKNDVVQLKVAMTAFITEYGKQPEKVASRLLDCLSGANERKIVFIELPKKQINENGVFVDPWGSPYQFGYNMDDGTWAYSFGKNRIDEGGRGDDVNSWQ